MPLLPTGELVERAQREGSAVFAFNVITLEHAEAIAAGAAAAGRPAILQISQNAVRYHGQIAPIALASSAVASDSPADLAVHLDHVDDLALLKEAASSGFSSVMFDAGALPYQENLELTRYAAEWAHDHGLWLEAELGYVGGKAVPAASAHAHGVRTDPTEAAEFVAATSVDALAVAVGSSHAMTTRTAMLDCDLIAQLSRSVPVPLVLHGSSGVPADTLTEAIRAGIVKVNIGTALNIAFTEAVRADLIAAPDIVDPRRYLRIGRDAMATAVATLIRGEHSPVGSMSE